MFIVCFGQGLGNQMFQYAFYLSLKKAYRNVDIRMDIDDIIPGDHNGFELDRIFGIERRETSLLEVAKLSNAYPPKAKFSFMGRKICGIARILYGNKNSNIKQHYVGVYYPEIYELSELKSYIFEGRWINEKYFENVKLELQKDFTFKTPLSGENYKIAQKIKSCNSVSIHIRRGDFVKGGYYILNQQYYIDALKYISEREENIKLFVFTDDKNSAEEIIGDNFEYDLISGNNGENSYIDMQLMSLCKHNIIANSSFSFWGAYLNKNPQKIVVSVNGIHPDIPSDGFSCKDWVIFDVEKYCK